jgi:hypothetical protein
LLFFVPRSIWPDKPFGSGLVVFEELGYWYVNVSMPLPMEFFLAAGTIGLVLGMVAVGGLVARLESACLRAGRVVGRTPADVFVALAGGFAIITMRGSLAAVAVFVGIPLAWAVAVAWFAAARRDAGAPAAAAPADPPASSFGDWRDRFVHATRRARRRPRVGRVGRLVRAGRGAAGAAPAARSGSRGG